MTQDLLSDSVELGKAYSRENGIGLLRAAEFCQVRYRAIRCNPGLGEHGWRDGLLCLPGYGLKQQGKGTLSPRCFFWSEPNRDAEKVAAMGCVDIRRTLVLRSPASSRAVYASSFQDLLGLLQTGHLLLQPCYRSLRDLVFPSDGLQLVVGQAAYKRW